MTNRLSAVRFCLLGFCTIALLFFGCRRAEPGTPIGTTYERIARPAVWRVLPRTQAESLGILPGDLILAYAGVPIKSVSELWQAQAQAETATSKVEITLLRDGQEVRIAARGGGLGLLLDEDRYPSSLAIALEDVLANHGAIAEYDWIAAALGESFTFTAIAGECPLQWPGAITDEYLESLQSVFGLSFKTVYLAPPEDTLAATETAAVAAVRKELEHGATVLVLGEWADDPISRWGIVTRFDGTDSLLYGFTTGAASEVPVTGLIDEVLTVGYVPTGEVDPAALLGLVLVHAIELGQAYEPGDWQSGIAAYDVWLAALDSVPFCPVCGDQSQVCFDALVWNLIANRESANRFLADMKEALPEHADLIDEIRTRQNGIIARLEGIARSGTTVGTIANQQKLGRVVGEIQQAEIDLQLLYQELLSELK